MNTLLIIILITITVLFILLAIPISLSLSVTRKQTLEGYASIVGLFGLLKFKTRFPGESKSKNHSTKKTKKILKTNTKTIKHNNNSQGFFLFTRPAFRQHIINFIKRLLIATHAKNLYLRCRIGLSDPADTGRLWAIMGPLSGILKNLQFMTIELEPEFINEGIELESYGHFRFIPLQFIALVLAFMLSPTTLRAWQSSR